MGNMDQVLFLWFFLGWIGGDFCNFIGFFFVDQLFLQFYIVVYYVMVDLVMLMLYFYYKFRKFFFLLFVFINFMLLFFMGMVCVILLLSVVGFVVVLREGFWGWVFLFVELGSKFFIWQEIIGFVIGFVFSVLYLFFWLFQICINFFWKFIQGIFYLLFVLVMLGNMLYGLSVLFKNFEEGQSEGSYLLYYFFWFVGSLGVLLFDIIIFIQFLVYRCSVVVLEFEFFFFFS